MTIPTKAEVKDRLIAIRRLKATAKANKWMALYRIQCEAEKALQLLLVHVKR